jgi:formylglycine-generating enzyme required for sulfatase activity
MAFMLLMSFVAAVGVWGGVRWNEALNHPVDFQNEHPAHAVTLTKPYYVAKYAVTQEQHPQIVGLDYSHFNGKDNPVDYVSWDDAKAFCKMLMEQTKQSVRLPTEAEWEFACRAGTTSTYYSGNTEADLARVAWYSGNSKSTTHPVGQKEPNAFGLYDMHGNVWQWCEDWYAEDYYGNAPAENPDGPAHGADRVLRGGSWDLSPVYCPSGYRGRFGPDFHYHSIGFRVVVSVAVDSK